MTGSTTSGSSTEMKRKGQREEQGRGVEASAQKRARCGALGKAPARWASPRRSIAADQAAARPQPLIAETLGVRASSYAYAFSRRSQESCASSSEGKRTEYLKRSENLFGEAMSPLAERTAVFRV